MNEEELEVNDLCINHEPKIKIIINNKEIDLKKVDEYRIIRTNRLKLVIRRYQDISILQPDNPDRKWKIEEYEFEDFEINIKAKKRRFKFLNDNLKKKKS